MSGIHIKNKLFDVLCYVCLFSTSGLCSRIRFFSLIFKLLKTNAISLLCVQNIDNRKENICHDNNINDLF